MRALIQRVSAASVEVENVTVGSIGRGLAVFLGVGVFDSEDKARHLARKVCRLRIFSDLSAGTLEGRPKLNLSVSQVHGEILVVSQFTLYADVSKSTRLSFEQAAKAAQAEGLVQCFVEACRLEAIHVQTGRFGAQMKVSTINDGPVTVWCEND